VGHRADRAVTGAGDRIDLYLAGTWGDTADGVTLLGALRDAIGAGPRLGAYVPILPPYPADADAFAARWQALRDGGADELHLYHAGLASPQRLEAARTALRALTAASPKEHR
jgi:hypothetical protein